MYKLLDEIEVSGARPFFQYSSAHRNYDTMDYKEPKTRKEMKGRDKERDANPYSQKRVRQVETLMEKRKANGVPTVKKGK
jgi:hypothetical protein